MDKLESDLESFVRICHLHEKVDMLEHALAEKDREIARWKNTIRDEYVGFLAESKENLLQQYVNLTQMYGDQKHEIRRLIAAITEKDREIATWKAAHDEMVSRNKLLRDRPDLPIERIRAYDEWIDKYHALMRQAVRFASCLQDKCICQTTAEINERSDCAIVVSKQFLASPKVRAWREHKDGTK